MGIISTMGSKRIIWRTTGSGLNVIHRGRQQPSKRAVRGTRFKLSVIWGWWPSLHVRVRVVDCVPLWGKGGWCACLVVNDLVWRQNEHIVDFCGWWWMDVLVVKMLAASVQTDVSVNGYVSYTITHSPSWFNESDDSWICPILPDCWVLRPLLSDTPHYNPHIPPCWTIMYCQIEQFSP